MANQPVPTNQTIVTGATLFAAAMLLPLISAASTTALDQAATSKIVVDFPVLGTGQLSETIYIYACDTDASCASKTQVSDYGVVTNVHRWPKGTGGPGGPPPATWVFLSVFENIAQYFEFWQQGASGWQSCILGVTADGDLDTTATSCIGVVPAAAKTVDGVPQFSMGAAMFPQASSQSDPSSNPNPHTTNTMPARGLNFVNQSSAANLCLQTDSSFEHQGCSGSGATSIAKHATFTIDDSALQDGSNSGLAQVMAYQKSNNARWIYTGRDASGLVYATNLEWTIWPAHEDYTPGPTTIDISLVNGFNIGVELVPERDTVCSIADTEGGSPYFVMYRAGTPMARFPSHSTTTLDQVCPTANQAQDNSSNPSTGASKIPIANQPTRTGCYSACTQATISNQQVAEMCCSAPYNTASSCTLPPTTAYVQNIDANSDRVYAWAYQDYRGTFTCEPTAEFTFRLLDPPQASSPF